ncbi:hypothetical protein Dsin_021295 [Dipteronia sinensis]|uniref:Uncharacterized protein n=1 Tax=Dipteronia sinensis TaxID=43782 RepID=A0AAD9ZZE9_9ROSI|nr:hypothetical protein Dsin_021295 [Dipteronia sinensis]
MFLNKGGRLMLIKAVMASIPNYFLSVFKILVSFAKRIERLQRNFFWGDGAEKRKIHSVKWETLCKSRINGGLGIGSVIDKNKGLLAKWVWRFGKEEIPLWKRVICGKYGVPSNSLSWSWKCGSTGSFFSKAVGGLFQQDAPSARILIGWYQGDSWEG